MPKNLSDENFRTEWEYFKQNLVYTGLESHFDMAKLEQMMRYASCALSADTGCAYPGALLYHVNLLTRLALRMSKMVSKSLPVDEKSLIKVCCLQHLSKIEMYIPNDNQWEIEKRGLVYKFNETKGRLKFGERSLLNATNIGITFTPEEWEAMKALDDEESNVKSKYFDSNLTMVVRLSNEIAYKIEREN